MRRAAATAPISDLQIEYSLLSRGIEAEILPAAREHGIGITAYGVLSRGLLSGHWSKDRDVSKDFRGASPRFQGENLDHNLAPRRGAARRRRRGRGLALPRPRSRGRSAAARTSSR